MKGVKKISIVIGIVVFAALAMIIVYLRNRAPSIEDVPVSSQVQLVSTTTESTTDAREPISVPPITPTVTTTGFTFAETVTTLNTSSTYNTLLAEKRVKELVIPTVSTNEIGTTKDSDSDTIPDAEESRYGTDPKKKDTDGDTYSDADEIKNGYNPLGPGKCAVSTCIIK